jgi:hypothetical protein
MYVDPVRIVYVAVEIRTWHLILQFRNVGVREIMLDFQAIKEDNMKGWLLTMKSSMSSHGKGKVGPDLN